MTTGFITWVFRRLLAALFQLLRPVWLRMVQREREREWEREWEQGPPDFVLYVERNGVLASTGGAKTNNLRNLKNQRKSKMFIFSSLAQT